MAKNERRDNPLSKQEEMVMAKAEIVSEWSESVRRHYGINESARQGTDEMRLVLTTGASWCFFC